MSWAWVPYLAGISGNLQAILALFSIFGFLVIVLIPFIHYVNKDKFLFGNKLKLFLVMNIFMCLLAACIPSKNTVYAMAGFAAASTVIKSETMSSTAELANTCSKKQLEEINKKDGKK